MCSQLTLKMHIYAEIPASRINKCDVKCEKNSTKVHRILNAQWFARICKNLF